jgi:predicted TIM-barrel fold metal-dependent hydrolase
MTDLPKIISVDDHVVEPPHVWQDRLPAAMRDRGPRVQQARWGDFALDVGASYKQEITEDGTPGDYWLYEDRLIYVHKRHVAIPLDATPNGDVSRFDRSRMFIGAITYDEMRPGCYEPKARVDDMALAGIDGSICFPTFPRFCGQTFLEGNDHELGLACVQAYNDWMIDEWCGDSGGALLPLCLIPLWDAQLAAAEVTRNAARGARAVCFSEIPTHLKLPSIHTGYWDPFFAVCQETKTTVCMHIGSSSKMPAASPDAPPDVEVALSCNNSMASLMDFLFSGVLVRFPELKLAYSESQIGWIPYALERADNVELDEGRREDPRAAVDVLQGPGLRLLHERRVRRRVDRPRGRGQHLLRDGLPAHRHDLAVHAVGSQRDDRVAHRGAALQGVARQRHQDARPRPRLEVLPHPQVSKGS